MKDETILTGIGVATILLILVFLFAIWGGYPRGVYWLLDDHKIEQEKLIKEIQIELETIRRGKEDRRDKKELITHKHKYSTGEVLLRNEIKE